MERKSINRYRSFCKSLCNLAHDYDGELAIKYFGDITSKYYSLTEEFRGKAAEYFE